MNRREIRTYLQQVYGVEVQRINTRVVLGKTVRSRPSGRSMGNLMKRPDYKLAYATFVRRQPRPAMAATSPPAAPQPEGTEFTFPDLFPNVPHLQPQAEGAGEEGGEAGAAGQGDEADVAVAGPR